MSPSPLQRLLPVAIVALAVLAGAGVALSGAVPGGRLAGTAAPGAGLPTLGSTRSGSGDPYGVVTNLRVGLAPSGVAYDSATHEVFVTNSNSNNVSVVAEGTSKVIATVVVGSSPMGLAYDSGKAEVFVANTGSDNVSVISDASRRVVATVALSTGDWPVAAVYDAARGSVFVANFGSNSVAEISDTTNAVVGTVSTGPASSPVALALDSGRNQLFVSLHSRGSVAVIDLATMAVASVLVGQGPMGLAYDSARGEVFVANNGSNTVSVIADTNDTVVATVPVATNPTGVGYSAATGVVAVTHIESFPPMMTFAMLSLIADSNNSVVATVGLLGGGAADAVAYDSGNGGWYVADTAVDSLVVVAPGHFVTFTQTGLPDGVSWEVWLNGTTGFGANSVEYFTSVSTLRTSVPDGSYSFAVVPVAGYVVTPSSGTFVVAGAGVSRALTFAFLYRVTFTETGLPSGTLWSVTFAGTTKTSNTTVISFLASNGTLSYSVGGATGYVANPASGNLTVNGIYLNQNVVFAPQPAAQAFPVEILLVAVVAVVVIAVVVGLVVRGRRRRLPPGEAPPPESGLAPPPP